MQSFFLCFFGFILGLCIYERNRQRKEKGKLKPLKVGAGGIVFRVKA